MATPARSLADDLRQRDDATLVELLQRRPDLAHPLPSDLGQLAARSVTQAATARAVDRLDQFSLQVLDAVCVVGEPFDEDAVVALFPAASKQPVLDALTGLVSQALVWGQPGSWRVTAATKELVGRYPAGLGPRSDELSASPLPDDLAEVVATAPSDVVAVLQRLTWGPPTGRVENADRTVSAADAGTPVEWLLARGLLVPLDKRTTVLPAEVGLHLRQGRLHATVHERPPEPEVQEHLIDPVDRAAAGTAFEVVRRVEDLLESWSVDAPTVLRGGGLGVRELRSTAGRLDVDESTAALLIEVAHAAGLLASSGDADDAWLPTPAFDVWRAKDTALRWVQLAEAWLETTRVPGLVGLLDNQKTRANVLSPDLDRVVAPDIRLAVLEDLAVQPPGVAITVESLARRQEWRRPRRGGRLRDDFVQRSVAEGTALGICASGALATPARELLAGDTERAVVALRRFLPEPVSQVLLQADLTAVAPGPLKSDIGRELGLLADVESSGGATVFRFSGTSIRRALDAGRSAIDIHSFLEAHSQTAVPQPLQYLVDDVARRHGRIRVGTASSYVRSDDPSVLDELMADSRSSALRLRRLAPTVAASPATPDVVLDRLRQQGQVPAAESTDGTVLVRRPDSRRTGPRQRPPRLRADPAAPEPSVARAAVRALRSGERGAGREKPPVGPAATKELPRTAVNETLQTLREAVQRSRSVWLGYVGTDGVATERVVDPVEVRGGWLTAFDQRVEQVRTFAVHRITGVSLLDAQGEAAAR